jgi:hypothetical protein
MARTYSAKERDVGPRPGDRQPAHEGGRGGTGTRPGSWDIGRSGGQGPRPSPSPATPPSQPSQPSQGGKK